jgi:4-methyl-5(b-hydroxyethyl)-thiazole monophosphate biosynthesis
MYGGLCYSPLILQRQGLLQVMFQTKKTLCILIFHVSCKWKYTEIRITTQDKKATAHPAIVNQLTCQVIDRSKVVIDGNLITGKGLGTVIDFSLAIIRKFFGHRRAKLVANGLVFYYPKS